MKAAPVLRAILRESRASGGRLVFFTVCLAIGVAAVVGVSSLVAAMDAGMRSESRSLLAADLRVSARRPLPDELAELFDAIPHERADLDELAAMASGPGDGSEAQSRLVEVKAVAGAYPFYGELVLEPGGLALDELAPDEVFAAPELLLGLGIEVGDALSLGGASFRVRAAVLDEPDRLDFAMTLGPRVFMTRAGLERTALLAQQSRVRHRALFRIAGEPGPEELEQLVERLKRELDDPAYLQFRTHTDAQPNVRRSLGRVEEFLGLAALLSLLLGGIGVSQIVRAWLSGRTTSVAVLRCLGLRAREIAVVYLGHVALLAAAGSLAGGALGALIPWGVRAVAPDLFQGGAAHLWQPAAVARGVLLGVAVAMLFSLPALTAVWSVPAAVVLRAEAVPLRSPRIVRFGAPLVAFVGVLGLARLQGGTWLAAGAFSLGLLVLAAVLFAGAWLATRLASVVPRGRTGPYIEHGLASLARPGAGTTGAIVALGIGVMVIVSMLLIERRLGHALRTALPADAPSVFLVDVQPEQWEGVQAELARSSARSVDSVPVVMARLREVDGEAATARAARYRDERRGAWVFTREQRLTWMAELPADNVLVDGALWSDPERAEVSLEQDFAEDLGVGVGSVLVLDVQGIELELAVTSLRTVDWQSFGINFFLVVEPGVLEDAPHFRIAAARVDEVEAEYALQNALAAGFPNVTMLRIRPILEKVAGVVARLAVGVRSLGGFTILTGLVILAGAVATGALRRGREAALLKALGVTRFGVTRLFAFEYAISGLVAGTIGSGGALVLAWAFLEQLAELDADLPLAAVPLGALATAGLASLSGLAASVRALRARPLETLRG